MISIFLQDKFFTLPYIAPKHVRNCLSGRLWVVHWCHTGAFTLERVSCFTILKLQIISRLLHVVR